MPPKAQLTLITDYYGAIYRCTLTIAANVNDSLFYNT